MSIETLNTLKIVTTVIAPILTMVMAILGAMTDSRKEIEVKFGEVIQKKKVLTPYGRIIITLLVISGLLTLSGIYVDDQIAVKKEEVQREIDQQISAKRDSILSTAQSTLDSISSALKSTQQIQVAAQDIAQDLSSQTKRIEKLSVPLFPMKIIYMFSRTDNLKEGIYGADNGISSQQIIDLMNSNLGTKGGHGQRKYDRGELYYLSSEKPQTPYYLQVNKTSYNDSKKEESNLQRLNKLVYEKFAPLNMECNFYNKYENYKNYDDIPLKIFVGKIPKWNTDVLFSYTLTVFPPDSIHVLMEIEVSDPGHVFNDQNSLSWMDFDHGGLRIYNPWGRIHSIKFFTGPQFSYSVPFEINEEDRIGRKTEFKKRININE